MQRFLLALGMLGLCATAYAGAKFNYPVIVNASSRSAQGDLGSARNSADTTQYISCYTFVEDGFARTGVCVALDAGGHIGVCMTQSADFVDQIRSLTGDAYIRFSWDASSNCTEVLIYNSSYSKPKAP